MNSESGNRRSVIDWLGFTFPESIMKYVVQESQFLLSAWLGEQLVGEDRKGRNFYDNTVQFSAMRAGELIPVAHIAWGGENQRGRANIQLTGAGCSMVKNWEPVAEFLDSCDARITRVDLAVDLLNGEHTLDEAFDWYRDGRFNINRQPMHRVIGPWLDESQGTGRTLEVGRRKNGKMARIYEKGKQLGDASSPWVRFEGELHNIDRELPVDILRNPDPYFSGMYPCFEQLLEVASLRIKTEQTQGETSIARLMDCLKASYGKAIFVARMQSPDHHDFLDDIQQIGVPKRLSRSSLHMMTNAYFSPPEAATVIGEFNSGTF